jgi:hypothetical protein
MEIRSNGEICIAASPMLSPLLSSSIHGLYVILHECRRDYPVPKILQDKTVLENKQFIECSPVQSFSFLFHGWLWGGGCASEGNNGPETMGEIFTIQASHLLLGCLLHTA